ncbi:MAG: two-component regulator propeller domain-containing protein, partial [Verrucomicrobiota bacterium]
MDPSPGRRVLRSVMTDGDGRVWMGSFGSIVVHDGKQRRAYGSEAGVPAHLIWDLADVGGGEVWAATTLGLIRGKGGRFEEVAGPDVLGQGETYRVLGEGGRAWCLSRDALSRWDGAGWTILAQAEPAGAGGLMGMSQAAGGGLWVAYEGEVRLLRDGRWAKSWKRPLGMRGDVVRLLEDSRGNVWMGGWQHGLAVFAPDGRVRGLGREQGLPNESVSGLAEDGEGNVWVATNGGGLVRLRPLAFRVHGLESGVRQVVNHMVEVAPGRLLLATHGDGIMEMRDGRATPDPDRKDGGDPVYPWVSVLHRDRQGVLWAGLTGVGLGRRDDKGWSVVPGEQVGAQQVMSLHEDAAGRLWVGTVAGVAMGERGMFRPMGADSMAPHAVIVSMAEDGEGSLWCSGNHWGLYRLKEGRFGRVELPGIATNAGFSVVLRSRDGSVWVAAGEEGLAWVRNGKPTTFGPAQGLAALDFAGLMEDDDGHVWAASRTVVARITRESLEVVASGRGKTLDVRYFDGRDGLGMLSGESWWQGQMKASDGRLWFTTHRGLAVVDPRRLPVRTRPPVVEIRRVVRAAGEALVGGEGGGIELPFRNNLMEVRHHARVLGTPERVRYESRLLPAGGWRDIGASRSTLLRDLRPGTYRLEVRATLNGLEWGEAAGVPFVVRPPFWATWWFLVACGVAGAGGVGLAVRGMVRARYRRQDRKS